MGDSYDWPPSGVRGALLASPHFDMTLVKYAPSALASAKRLTGYRAADRDRRTGAADSEIDKAGARSVSMNDQTAGPLPCD